MDTAAEHNLVLRMREVIRMTGLSRSSIYSFIKDDKFPKQIKLGKRAVGWYGTDIFNWINGRRAVSDEGEK